MSSSPPDKIGRPSGCRRRLSGHGLSGQPAGGHAQQVTASWRASARSVAPVGHGPDEWDGASASPHQCADRTGCDRSGVARLPKSAARPPSRLVVCCASDSSSNAARRGHGFALSAGAAYIASMENSTPPRRLTDAFDMQMFRPAVFAVADASSACLRSGHRRPSPGRTGHFRPRGR